MLLPSKDWRMRIACTGVRTIDAWQYAQRPSFAQDLLRKPWQRTSCCGTSGQSSTSLSTCCLACRPFIFDLRVMDFVPWYGNAKYYANFQNEDLIGRTKLLAQLFMLRNNLRRLLSHSHPQTMSRRVLEHYCVMVTLLWRGSL